MTLSEGEADLFCSMEKAAECVCKGVCCCDNASIKNLADAINRNTEAIQDLKQVAAETAQNTQQIADSSTSTLAAAQRISTLAAETVTITAAVVYLGGKALELKNIIEVARKGKGQVSGAVFKSAEEAVKDAGALGEQTINEAAQIMERGGNERAANNIREITG